MTRSIVLPDHLAPGLRAVFVGTAVAARSAGVGGYYAGPGNQFWELLYRSGLTTERLDLLRCAEVLGFRLGLTDLAKRRVSSRDADLAAADFDVAGFVERIAAAPPEWVAFNGKTAARVVCRYLGTGRTVSLGRQSWRVAGVRVYVLPNTSAANANPAHLEGRASKLDWFRAFRRAMDRDVESGDNP